MQNPTKMFRAAAGRLLTRVRRTAGARTAVLLLALPLAAGFLVPTGAGAQQFVADDAAIVDFRACQLEAWHGQVASWILPACQLVRNLELTAGVGFVDDGDGRQTEYVLQGKYLFRELTANGVGVGLVAGLSYDPLSQVTGGVEGVFAYVPLSLSLCDDRVVLHTNVGWHFERGAHEHDGHVHDESRHALTWAARADLLIPVAGGRFTVIGELFGEDRLRPEYQVGVRTALIPDRLLVDMSWGGHTQGGTSSAGWSMGLAWTPPPFF